jgi:hypothetical protein
MITESPTTAEPTKEPTMMPTPPTAPVKAPTVAPTEECAPLPKKGCKKVKPMTLKQCNGFDGEFEKCCLWTPKVKNGKEQPGGKCTERVE